MIWQKTLKYPVLIIGIVWMGIFLSGDGWVKLKTRFYPDRYTCDTLTLRIKNKVGDNWKISCPDSMSILIIINFDKEIRDYEYQLALKNQKKGIETKVGDLRNKINMYKLLSNDILKLAKLSNRDTMENVKNVHMFMVSDQDNLALKLHAKTDGAAIVMIRETIYESNAQQVVKRAKAIVRDKNIQDPEKRSDLVEEKIHEILNKNAQRNMKKLPKLLSKLVKISEEKV